jgi:predicted acetyltransferase
LVYFQFFWENRQITGGINFVAVGVCFDRKGSWKNFTTNHTNQHEKGREGARAESDGMRAKRD